HHGTGPSVRRPPSHHGRRTARDRPSLRVEGGQTIQVHERSASMDPVPVAAARGPKDVLPAVPGYLNVNLEGLQATLLRAPKREEVPVTCDVQLVVEFYSR